MINKKISFFERNIWKSQIKSVQQYKTVIAIVGLQSEILVSIFVWTWFDFARYSS